MKLINILLIFLGVMLSAAPEALAMQWLRNAGNSIVNYVDWAAAGQDQVVTFQDAKSGENSKVEQKIEQKEVIVAPALETKSPDTVKNQAVTQVKVPSAQELEPVRVVNGNVKVTDIPEEEQTWINRLDKLSPKQKVALGIGVGATVSSLALKSDKVKKLLRDYITNPISNKWNAIKNNGFWKEIVTKPIGVAAFATVGLSAYMLWQTPDIKKDAKNSEIIAEHLKANKKLFIGAGALTAISLTAWRLLNSDTSNKKIIYSVVSDSKSKNPEVAWIKDLLKFSKELTLVQRTLVAEDCFTNPALFLEEKSFLNNLKFEQKLALAGIIGAWLEWQSAANKAFILNNNFSAATKELIIKAKTVREIADNASLVSAYKSILRPAANSKVEEIQPIEMLAKYEVQLEKFVDSLQREPEGDETAEERAWKHKSNAIKNAYDDLYNKFVNSLDGHQLGVYKELIMSAKNDPELLMNDQKFFNDPVTTEQQKSMILALVKSFYEIKSREKGKAKVQ